MIRQFAAQLVHRQKGIVEDLENLYSKPNEFDMLPVRGKKIGKMGKSGFCHKLVSMAVTIVSEI